MKWDKQRIEQGTVTATVTATTDSANGRALTLSDITLQGLDGRHWQTGKMNRSAPALRMDIKTGDRISVRGRILTQTYGAKIQNPVNLRRI